MRGEWVHAPEQHQVIPYDNTDAYVWGQCMVWANSGGTEHVHPEIAMQLAAYWHSPSNEALTAFGSTGTITDGLADEIDDERRRYAWATFNSTDTITSMERVSVSEALRNLVMLDALRAYVRACKVTVYTVGKNIAGYSPENEPEYRGLDYADAVNAYRSMLDEAPEDVTRNDECRCGEPETIDGGELCELCTVDALVKSYMADDGPVTYRPSDRYGKPAGLVIPADSWAGSMSYWLHVDTEPYGTLVDALAY